MLDWIKTEDDLPAVGSHVLCAYRQSWRSWDYVVLEYKRIAGRTPNWYDPDYHTYEAPEFWSYINKPEKG